ncbi:putative FAD-binding oxidoreductase [Daldinia vernicosa]|uniref:putative FAD-binding oxidoreductase n=1 Tax=Daldinia vernicosa TaxID=114800 RepID=UPI00200816EB|nr:putative FAD-binding oxidoreductase [Daldinia vernicosa]KAI0852738.1 putative FAD-binding oxidoreductase [Daldinia vernicosa]
MASTFVIVTLWCLFCFLYPDPAVSSGENTVAACQDLKATFKYFITTPDETEYSELRTENWSQTAWRFPSCIFRPNRVEQLQEAVPLLVQSKVKFAIRSGGHSPDPQAANIDGGILIDLSGFNTVDYDASTNTVIVGSGLTWGDLYAQLDQFNVTVVGGRIILANGSIANANKDQHPDLFWALKGGGNNFGIVTSFTLSTYPIHQVWAGIKTYAYSDLPSLYSAMLEYQTVLQKDPYANLDLQGILVGENMGLALSLVYLQPEEEPSAFAPFYPIKTISDSTQLTTLTEFLSGQGPGDFPRRVDWSTTSFTPNKALYTSLYDLVGKIPSLGRIGNVTSGTVVFGMQPISINAIEAGYARGGNALGLRPVDQTWYVIDAGWWDEKDDKTVHNSIRNITGVIEEASTRGDSYIPYLFMNDASWDQDVIGQYGEENIKRLKAVQSRYDPEHVFQKLVPGGFKLPS